MLSDLATLWTKRPPRRAPDFVIGAAARPYLKRWFVIPRNPFLNIYVHHILRSDDDRALHDHPWANLTYVTRGGYLEVVAAGDPRDPATHRRVPRREGAIVFRRARAAHRLEVRDHASAITLFITGPRVRDWGFWCPQGWRHWEEFVAPGATGQIGRGCE